MKNKEKSKKKVEKEVEKEVEKKVEKIKKVVKLPANPRIMVERMLSFDIWFNSKGFKPHWKAGMKAYTDTSRKHSKKEWEKIFKSY
jgi:hypothetical protein